MPAELPYQLDETDSAWALQEWWSRSGETYLRQFLELAPSPARNDERTTRPVVWPVAAMRKTLSKQHQPRHPLAHLLCDHDDEACHTRPAGWRMRAMHHLRLDAEKRRAERLGPDHACEERAKDAPAAERFSVWSTCLAETALKVRMFPLGGMRVAEDGWFVVRGRRGHHGFCDEIRAYDLSTGAFYAVQSCSRLALRRGGAVDHAATDTRRKPKTIVGRIPVAPLREAVWMTMMLPNMTEPGLDQPFGQNVPDGVEIGWPTLGGVTGFGVRYTASSGITTLAWGYHHRGNLLTGGQLHWPQDLNDAARDHAVKLLQIAEAQLVEGCAPAALPKLGTGGVRATVSGLDASPQSLNKVALALRQALDGLRKVAKRCPRGAP